MATLTLTRPAYKLSRSSSFDNAIPSLPPFLLGPLPRKDQSIERALHNLGPIIGQSLARAGAEAWKVTSARMQKFQQECLWGVYCWLFHPSAMLLLLLWPGWILTALAYWWWTH